MADELEKKESAKPKLAVKQHPLLLAKRGQRPHDPVCEERWPTLLSLLLPTYDTEQRLDREAGRLSVALDGTHYRIGLSCPTEGLQTHVLTSTLADMLDALEAHVKRADCSWVQDYESVKKHKQKIKELLGS